MDKCISYNNQSELVNLKRKKQNRDEKELGIKLQEITIWPDIAQMIISKQHVFKFLSSNILERGIRPFLLLIMSQDLMTRKIFINPVYTPQ